LLSVLGVFSCALLPALGAFSVLYPRIQFSRLLRRPGDPHTATVMASKGGGRTLILDIPWDGTGRGYQPLSEVRLALWMKAGKLVPGERVTVYGGPGGESPLLISSAQRGRAFLGTMQGRSTVQPGPTTEVDAFREEIRDTFLGATRSPVKSDDVRGTQFSSTTYFTHDEPNNRYDKKQVAAFLDAAGIRLAAMESTDRQEGPLVSDAIHADWAEWADSTRFSTSRLRVDRYDTAEVDAFREAVRDTSLGVSRPPLTWRAPPRQAVHDYPPPTTWLRP
jgi:hypothetical protein